MRLRVSLLAAVLLLAVAAGCRSERGQMADGVDVIDSAGVAIVTSGTRGLWGDDGGWRAVEDLNIGMAEGPAEYMFFRPRTVDVDSGGSLYVLDAGDKTVRVYDSEGEFVRRMGREGQGPGEFQDPSLMVMWSDTLAVYDWRLRRLSVFSTEGKLLDSKQVAIDAFLHGFATALARSGGDTLLLSLARGFSIPRRPESEGTGSLIRLTLDGRVIDTVRTFAGLEEVPHYSDRSLRVFSAPFARGPFWAVAPGGWIAFGHSDRYLIDVFTADGRVIRSVRRRDALERVSEEDVVTFRERFPYGQGLDSLPPEERRVAAAVLRDFHYPEAWPAFSALEFDAASRLWVRRPHRPDDESVAWDVFDEEGRYLGSLTLPTALRVTRITGEAIYGLERDELGVQYVKRYRIERS